MPCFRLETNVPQEKIPKDLPQKICNVLSKSLEKPMHYCVATVVGGVNMSWGSTDEPAAIATLVSIGSLGIEENKKHSKAFIECICEAIGISPDRMFIIFTELSTSNVGYKGTTFHEIFGQ